MTENEQGAPGANEGEGSRAADRRYREGVESTILKGHVEEDAEKARRDVEANPETYSGAEEQGRSRSAGEGAQRPGAVASRDAASHSVPARSGRKGAMSTHEAFNRSSFSQAINSSGGRLFRLVAGSSFLLVGLAYRDRPLGVAALVWSVFPLSAGIFDICWISAALGGPLSGAKIRAMRS